MLMLLLVRLLLMLVMLQVTGSGGCGGGVLMDRRRGRGILTAASVVGETEGHLQIAQHIRLLLVDQVEAPVQGGEVRERQI